MLHRSPLRRCQLILSVVKQPFSSKCKGSTEKYDIFRWEEHDTTSYKGMLYFTKTSDLVVEVKNRERMEVEKLVKETAINVLQKVYEFKSTKKP